MSEVDEAFADRLVELDSVGFLYEFADNLTLVVLHDQHLLGSNHLLNHDDSQVRQHLVVNVLPEGVAGEQRRVWRAAGLDAATMGEGVHIPHGQRLHLFVQLLYKLQPVVQGDLEDFAIVDLGDPDQIVVGMYEVVPVRELLDQLRGKQHISIDGQTGRGTLEGTNG